MIIILDVVTIECTLTAIDHIYLPDYKGSTLRGAINMALKNYVCLYPNLTCVKCAMHASCPYTYLCETSLFLPHLSPYEKSIIPTPLVFEPPPDHINEYATGASIYFRILLFGSAPQYIPLLVEAIRNAGSAGIGAGRGRFTLKNVQTIGANNTLYHDIPGADTVRFKGGRLAVESWEKAVASLKYTQPQYRFLYIRFLTPSRLKNKRRFVTELDFEVFFLALLRRVKALSLLYGQRSMVPGEEERILLEKAGKIAVAKSAIRWLDWKRNSSVSGTMKLGGIMGSILFEGNFSDFVPFILYGKIAHTGNSTVFGLGQYEATFFLEDEYVAGRIPAI